MASRQSNASLIRTLCAPIPHGGGFAHLGIIAALLAFPTAVLMDSFVEICVPPRLIAIILSPGHLLTTLATPNPQVIGNFFGPSSPHSALVFLVNLFYWFLILFGFSCCIAGLRKSDKPHLN
jgi:hypothetical protein